MEPIGCPETSVNNDQTTFHNIDESEDLTYTAEEACTLATIQLLSLHFSCTYLLYGMQQNATYSRQSHNIVVIETSQKYKILFAFKTYFAILRIFK